MEALRPDAPDDELAAALEANFAGRFSLYRWWPRAVVCDGPDLFWDLTDLPLPTFNNVLRARLPEAGVEAAIGHATARCLRGGVPMNWWVGPATRPIDLPAALEAHGFRRVKAELAMAADLQALDQTPASPPELVVERLTAHSDLAVWVDVLAESFDFPSPAREPFTEATMAALSHEPGAMMCYLGRLAGEPVATSFMVLAAGVAGLHGVGTLPQARRQGIGAAMTLAPLHEARILGYRVAVLRASALGAGVYRRLGFRQCGEVSIYTWWPPGQGMG